MRVLFQPFRGHIELRGVLRADGWTLEDWRDDTFLAMHPGVADEVTARGRLHRLGLLISQGLRIEFLPAVTRQPG
jgi:hypothetical protein